MTSQYFLRPSFTVVKIVVNNLDNGLVEHLKVSKALFYPNSLTHFSAYFDMNSK